MPISLLRHNRVPKQERGIGVKKYVVRLTEKERRDLEDLVRKGKCAARKLTHARVLLQADEGDHGPAWTATVFVEWMAAGGAEASS